MNAHPVTHPTDQTLNSYGLGKLDDGLFESVNKHLEQCSECRKRVAEMSADSFLGRIRDAQKSVNHPTFRPHVARSAYRGRFVPEDRSYHLGFRLALEEFGR